MQTIRKQIMSGILLCCLWLLPTLAEARHIEGVWKMESGNRMNYKVLKSNGTYINLRSEDGGRTFHVTRMGNYEIAAPGVYIEHLRYENGSRCDFPFTISYRKEKKKLMLTFDLHGTVCKETWKKVRSSVWRKSGRMDF